MFLVFDCTAVRDRLASVAVENSNSRWSWATAAADIVEERENSLLLFGGEGGGQKHPWEGVLAAISTMFETQKMPKYLNNHGFCEKYISNYFHNLLGLSDFDKNAKKYFNFAGFILVNFVWFWQKNIKKYSNFADFVLKDLIAKAKKRIFFSMLWISYIFAC